MAARYDLSDDEKQAQITLAEELDAEGVEPDGLDVENEEHPEGSKRGGYVPVFYGDNGARVFYDSTACEWVPYDGC